jgi:hypothetical protein
MHLLFYPLYIITLYNNIGKSNCKKSIIDEENWGAPIKGRQLESQARRLMVF